MAKDSSPVVPLLSIDDLVHLLSTRDRFNVRVRASGVSVVYRVALKRAWVTFKRVRADGNSTESYSLLQLAHSPVGQSITSAQVDAILN